jgi:hypothetical protein
VNASAVLATPPAQRLSRYDFDGDRKADLSLFRPSNNMWYLWQSTAGFMSVSWGVSTDVRITGDFDGDGKGDLTVWRPSTGQWFTLKSSNLTVNLSTFGVTGDTPVAADYDADGKVDLAQYRPSTGQWFVLRSSSNSVEITAWGNSTDVPEPADYDGDGKCDIAVYRPSNGVWYAYRSTAGVMVSSWGIAGDIPVPADYDGDNKDDLAIYRPSSGTWYIYRSSNAAINMIQWGNSTDVPVQRDFDGDGKDDIAVYRPSEGVWHILQSGSGTYMASRFGISTDVPVTASAPGPGIPVVPPTFTCDYYASPSGVASGNGSATNPWDLQTALGKTSLITASKTLCLKGGTYTGKFKSTLTAGTVRSAPGEWAQIDGYKFTTLMTSMNATQQNFTMANASGFFVIGNEEIVIDGEVIKLVMMNGNNVTSCLRGASNSLNGAQPHTAGTPIILGGSPFYVAGSNTTYRDFEVMNSRPSRDGNVENQGLGRGDGITVVGAGNKLVNLVIHDNLSGIMTSSMSSNTEIYGCLIYNNGMHSRNGGTVENGYGHGMYLENSAGFSKIYENIVLNSFNLGTQCYGVTAPYFGGQLIGDAFSNSGSPLGKFDPAKRNYNLIIGPDSQASPTAILSDSHFYQPSTTIGYSVKFGYGAGVGTGTVTNNTFVGGGTMFEIANTNSATISGNRFYSSQSGAVYTIVPSGRSYSWNNNTYYSAMGRNVFGIAASGTYQFANWRSLTGFDANSTATSTAMPTTVVVRPNSYQPGRANVFIYAIAGSTSVSVDLSTAGLSNGQHYTLRNAQNYSGAPVTSGNFDSANPLINVSLTGAAASVATPVGYSYTPPTTCPQFCPMVVVPN